MAGDCRAPGRREIQEAKPVGSQNHSNLAKREKRERSQEMGSHWPKRKDTIKNDPAIQEGNSWRQSSHHPSRYLKSTLGKVATPSAKQRQSHQQNHGRSRESSSPDDMGRNCHPSSTQRRSKGAYGDGLTVLTDIKRQEETQKGTKNCQGGYQVGRRGPQGREGRGMVTTPTPCERQAICVLWGGRRVAEAQSASK